MTPRQAIELHTAAGNTQFAAWIRDRVDALAEYRFHRDYGQLRGPLTPAELDLQRELRAAGVEIEGGGK